MCLEAYLRRYQDTPIASELQLDRDDLSPVERLLAIFDPLETDPSAVQRGCPFHNAAIEAAGEIPDIAQLVERHKRDFRDRLIVTAAEAGAPDPDGLARQLAVIFVEPRGTGWRQVASLALMEAYQAQYTDTLRRLKSCRNTRCLTAFYDRSRNNSGVWHDVRVCGNAANLRNYRARKRAGADQV
ncbi:CGNR zinc finger domain-containing protein [Streptomyces sp. NPDC002076]